MRDWLKKAMGLALCSAMVFAACGDDDDDGGSPTAPQDNAAAGDLPPEAIQLTGLLVASFQTAFFASLVADTTSVPGIGGSIEIMGNEWVLQDFSPDGQLVLNGTLIVAKELFPNIPVMGSATLSGSQEGTIELDMLISVEGTDLSATGTITIDGVDFDIAELISAASAAADAAGGG